MGKTSKAWDSQEKKPGFLNRRLKLLLSLLVSGTLAACSGALNRQQDPTPECRGLSAHDSRVAVCATVPKDEPASIGTVQIILHSNIHKQKKPQQLKLERDGTPEQLWLLPSGSDYPVVVLLTRSAGSGSYPELQGLQWINGEYWPLPLARLSELQRQGYMGHDQIQVMDGQLYRRFPIYRQTDANNNPSGGEACFRYDLKQEEWYPCPD